MMPTPGIGAFFDRVGEQVEVYGRIKEGRDDFNNPRWDWRFVDVVPCVARHGNSAFEVNEPTGEYDVDVPTFYFLIEDMPPTTEARVKRLEHPEQQFYEMQAYTIRRNHVEVPGELVRDDDPPVEKYGDEPFDTF